MFKADESRSITYYEKFNVLKYKGYSRTIDKDDKPIGDWILDK